MSDGCYLKVDGIC